VPRPLVTLSLAALSLLVASTAGARTITEGGLSYTVPDGMKVETIKLKGVKAWMAADDAAKLGVLAWTLPLDNTTTAQLTALLGQVDTVLEGTNCGSEQDRKTSTVNGIPVAYYSSGARFKKNQEQVGLQLNVYANKPRKTALVMLVFWGKANAASNKPLVAKIIGSVKK
jgi:hypothetical protein